MQDSPYKFHREDVAPAYTRVRQSKFYAQQIMLARLVLKLG